MHVKTVTTSASFRRSGQSLLVTDRRHAAKWKLDQRHAQRPFPAVCPAEVSAAEKCPAVAISATEIRAEGEQRMKVRATYIFFRMRDIVKTYPLGDEETVILKGISLNIFRGEYISVLGPFQGQKIDADEYYRRSRRRRAANTSCMEARLMIWMKKNWRRFAAARLASSSRTRRCCPSWTP